VADVPPRPVLSEEEERAEWEDQSRLRAIDAKLDTLFRRRQELIAEMRNLSAEQKALYDRRQAPQEEVERLYEEHGDLGKKLSSLRAERDAARRKAEEALIHLRELKLTFAPGERVNPEQLRREIAQLELRQQTHALPLDEENALIAHLRQRTKELKEVEARATVVAEHERQRKEAEAQVTAARAEVDRLGHEWTKTRAERDAKMAAVRSMLETAGGLIAELRAKGRARAEVMEKIDAVSREMMELEREGRKLLGQTRARREEARRTLRAYSHHREPAQDLAASTAEAQLEELLRRGRITLGG
jgi:uncharacterized coiled-coil DUF342 family protein